jgi:hypothetical protein
MDGDDMNEGDFDPNRALLNSATHLRVNFDEYA